MHITSLQNPLVKRIAKLRSSARERRRAGLMLVEGLDEIELAIAAGHKPRTLVTSQTEPRGSLDTLGAESFTVSARVFEKLSYRENPDGWLALFETPTLGLEAIKLSTNPLLVIVEAVEKPGNLGAILRTADAAGVEAIVVCDAQADIYGPNVVRSSRGTVFSVPMVQVPGEQALDFMRAQSIRIVATTPGATAAYTSEDLSGPVAVAVGAESLGLSEFWLEHADAQVRIPMSGKANSLNVSVAAALLVYEALRQRGERTARVSGSRAA
jgi:TrmH family RNA methyltransferase